MVEYRAAAFAMFCESEPRGRKDGPPLDPGLSELCRGKRKLFVKSGQLFEHPFINTFGDSTGSNIRAKGFLNGNVLKPGQTINADNIEIRVSLVAEQHSAFEIAVRPAGKGFADPFVHD